MSRFVIGDIHGGFQALMEVLELAGFVPERDTLITLGDTVNGWSESQEVLGFLKSLPNHIGMIGNHEIMFLRAFESGNDCVFASPTLLQYESMPELLHEHIEYIKTFKPFHIEDGELFIHAGYNSVIPKDGCQIDYRGFFWDELYSLGVRSPNFKSDPNFKHVYIGHVVTSTKFIKTVENVTMMDCGAGFNGRLGMMNLDTREVYHSRLLPTLYPKEKGRN